MPSLVEGFAYDIFISYRQKDNKGDRWVTSFVEALKNELDATFKDEVSIYFDENPHDGLLESHHVDKSLEGKLRSAILIPIVSQTYCDPKAFAWEHEFCAFNRLTKADACGPEVRLHNGNVASRVLPVRINDVEAADRNLFERETGSVLRAIDFIYKTPGVNRPLTPNDKKEENLNRTIYRDQVNKVANAVKDILAGMREPVATAVREAQPGEPRAIVRNSFWNTAAERDLWRVALVYIIFGLIVFRLGSDLVSRVIVPKDLMPILIGLLAAGFPLAVWLAWRYEFSPSGIIRSDSPDSKSNPYRGAQKHPFTGNLALLILVILLVAHSALMPSAKTSETKSIAVLYFDNLSADPEQEFFTAGITDEISAHLSRIPSLRVTSRTSVLPYKGKSKAMNIREIAEELGVENILDGSVQKSGNKLHITAQLIDVKTDQSVWSETFDSEVTEVFSIQSKIARAIARKFQVTITPEVNARLQEVPTTDMQAYDLYLKARALPGATGFGIGTSYATTKQGLRLMKQAVKLDPDFAEAYVLLSEYYAQMGEIDSAVMMAKEGVLANPSSPAPYIALSLLTSEVKWLKRSIALDTVSGLRLLGWAIFWSLESYPGTRKPFEYLRKPTNENNSHISVAMSCFMEARRRAPNSVTNMVALSRAYNWIGERDSARYYLAMARQMDPRSREVLEQEVTAERFYKDLEEFKSLALQYYGSDSLGFYKDLGVHYLYARRWKEAEAAYAKTNYRDLDVGLVLYKTGREDSGRRVFLKSLAYYDANPGAWKGNYARIHAVLGNREKALTYYKELTSNGLYINFFKIDPFTDYIRDDPEYKKLEAEAEASLRETLMQIRSNAGKPFSLPQALAVIE